MDARVFGCGSVAPVALLWLHGEAFGDGHVELAILASDLHII